MYRGTITISDLFKLCDAVAPLFNNTAQPSRRDHQKRSKYRWISIVKILIIYATTSFEQPYDEIKHNQMKSFKKYRIEKTNFKTWVLEMLSSKRDPKLC